MDPTIEAAESPKPIEMAPEEAANDEKESPPQVSHTGSAHPIKR